MGAESSNLNPLNPLGKNVTINFGKKILLIFDISTPTGKITALIMFPELKLTEFGINMSVNLLKYTPR